MPVVIEVNTEAFPEQVSKAVQTAQDKSHGVRRPLRGIEIKDDRYASMQIIRKDGGHVPLTDAGGRYEGESGYATPPASGVPARASKKGGGYTYNYTNFIIQQVSDSRQEKSQIMETFGDSYVFFFGEKPRLLQVSGLLFNTLDFNWRTEFWYNYENVLRGTRLVEQGARLYLQFDDIIVEGYMLNAAATDDASQPYHIPFQFSLFVTNHMYLSAVGDTNYPTAHAVVLDPLSNDQERQLNGVIGKDRLIQADKFVSTTEAVRRASKAANLNAADRAANLNRRRQDNAFNMSKNLLLSAINLGITAQNFTFMGVANQFLRGRNRVRIPRGFAGSEAIAGRGSAAYVQSQPAPPIVQRNRENNRSKIKDNFDEYLGRTAPSANYDVPSMEAVRQQQIRNGIELEKRGLIDLENIGVNTIKQGGQEALTPFTANHTIGVSADSADGSLATVASAGGFQAV